MRTTQEYFKMSKEELRKVANNYGYTREECKLLDESERTVFYSESKQIEEDKAFYMSQKYEIGEFLKMTDGRYALLLN